MKTLKQLLGICEHTWSVTEQLNLVEFSGAMPHGQKYILTCSKCGDIKSKRV